MRFIMYLLGVANAYVCANHILAILNGDVSKSQMFFIVWTGATAIGCFAAAFNSLLNHIYKEDNGND